MVTTYQWYYKILMGIVCGFVFIAAQATEHKINNSSIINPDMHVSRNKIGGWYPVFFDNYNEKQLGLIIQQINNNKVRKVIISYDKNTTLASKISTNIQSSSKLVPEIKHNVLEDNSAIYAHDRVVVTVYLNQ